VVEGQAGIDTLAFNGANVAETIDISANGGRVRFFRDVANVRMDLNDVETLAFKALGGADRITVGDLSGTDVRSIALDLSAAGGGGGGGGGGDGQADTVIVNATNGADAISLLTVGDVVIVSGLEAELRITGFDAGDRLVVNGLGGDDLVEASRLQAGMLLLLNGGDGDDVLIGGAGIDTLNGDAGDDILIGRGGLDLLDGGAGDNILIQ
jgi:Ca2+-binding RTX toxin-like protein